MKKILILLLFFAPLLAFAQYPNSPNKIRLGNQTTGDGLVFRGNGAPGYTPTGINNAWMYLDTVGQVLYFHVGGVWTTVADGNGLFSVGNDGDTIRVQLAYYLDDGGITITDTTGTAFLSINKDAATVSAGTSQIQAVKPLGYLLLQGGDSLLISIGGSFGNAGQVPTASGDGGTFWQDVSTTDTSGYNLAFSVVGDSLVITDGQGSLSVATADIGSTEEADGVTILGVGTNSDPFRVDTTVMATLNALQDTAFAIRGDLPAGSGTTNRLAKWTSSTTLGDGGVEDDNAGLITVLGTRALRLPVGTTAQRSTTPVNGETRRNTTTNFGETFDGTNWRQAEFPVGTAAGNTTYFNGTNWVQSGNIFNNNGNVGIGTTTPGRKLSVTGTTALAGNTTVSVNYPTNSYAALTVFPPNTTPSTYGGALFVGTRAALQYRILNQDFTTEVNGGMFYPSENNGFIPLIAVGGGNSKIFRSLQSGWGQIGGAFTSGMLQGGKNGVGLIAQAYTSQLVNSNWAIGFISTAWAEKGDLSGTLIGALIEARGDSVDVTNTRTYTASRFRVTGPELTTKIGIDIDFIGAGTKRAIISRQGDNLLAGKTRIGNITEADEALHVTGKVKIDTLTDTAESLAGYTGTTGPGVATRVGVGDNMILAGGTLSVPTRYAIVTLSSAHTMSFLSSSTAPDSVGNLQVADIGGIFTVSGGGKTVKYAGSAGYFLVNYATSFLGIEGIHLSHVWLNGNIIESSRTRTEAQTTPLSVAGVTIVYLTAGDELQFGYTPDNHSGDNDIITSHLTITITRI